MLDAVFVFFLFCFCFGSNRFYARRCFVHLEMYSHCRCVPALKGQSFWDSEEFCSDGGRSLLLVGFPTQAWRSVACSWFTSPSFLLLHLPHRMLRAKFLARSERSDSSSSAAGVDTTSTQARFLELVQLCCDVHVRNNPPSVPQAPKGVDDGGATASVVSSRGVCGGVVALRFTMLFPLHVMFASLQCSG